MYREFFTFFFIQDNYLHSKSLYTLHKIICIIVCIADTVYTFYIRYRTNNVQAIAYAYAVKALSAQ